MSKKLTHKEIKEIIQKLSDQYEEYAVSYGKGFFDKKAFEDRYMEALKSDSNLESFAYAEVSFFEDLKKKFDRIQEEKRIRIEKPFTRKVEKYIEELEKRWLKYPELFAASELSDEAKYFCGAIQEFYHLCWLPLEKGAFGRVGAKVLLRYNSLTETMQSFILSISEKFPYEVERYGLNLSKYGVEKTHMIFLKEGALLLKEIRIFFKTIEQVHDDISEELKNSEIFLKAKKMLDQIIYDFRLSSLI
ncbi:MAG: hypothetical protein KKH98_08895 [Spirochaetes bacterium]|nr:hypothetical protein [Spirochaetota bacterium]